MGSRLESRGFNATVTCRPQEPCGNCGLCLPALQHQQKQVQTRPRPPSPKEPHPDDVDPKLKQTNKPYPEELKQANRPPSPSPSPSPPPSAKPREATPLRQTSKNQTSVIPDLPKLVDLTTLPPVSLPNPPPPPPPQREAAPMHLVQTQTVKKQAKSEPVADIVANSRIQ